MKRILAGLFVCLLAVGCSSVKNNAPNATHLAEEACNTNGQAAVSYAQQAAKLDPTHFGKLAADELALAGNIAAQQTNAPGGDDSDLSGLTGEEGTGSGSSYAVLLDCKNISLQLLPGQ
ncbi:MAG TPA: hypothetical protein VHC43_06590 [Mycobacteriales bacterium]|nr:hypothetical protein [Mycobacteriales bacterium]